MEGGENATKKAAADAPAMRFNATWREIAAFAIWGDLGMLLFGVDHAEEDTANQQKQTREVRDWTRMMFVVTFDCFWAIWVVASMLATISQRIFIAFPYL